MKTTPVFLNTPVSEASKEDVTQHIEEVHANKKCAERIDKAINDNFDGYHLNTKQAIIDILKDYSPERAAYVMAVRVHDNDGFDGRISKTNEEWGKYLLKYVPELYKDKQTSSLSLSSYLSSHNGLVDMLISDFRKVFPEIELTSKKQPATYLIIPEKYAAQPIIDGQVEDRFDTDYDDSKEMGYVCFEMQEPPAEIKLELLRRVENFSEWEPHMEPEEYIVSCALDEKMDNRGCYADVFEDGSIMLILHANKIPLKIEEGQQLRKNLQEYTKNHFKANLAQTISSAMRGEHPSELFNEGRTIQNYKD